MHRAAASYAQAPSDEAELIRRYGSVIDRVARRVAARSGGYVTPDDLWSAGALGLIDAARRFDATRAVKFESFVEHRIRGAMLDELRKQDHLPRRLRDDSDTLRKQRAKLSNELGRDPNLEELAAATGFDAETIYSIDSVSTAPSPLMEDLPVPSEDESADEQLANKEIKGQLAAAISKLPERHALVLSLHYVEELSYKEIATVLEISSPRVCQLHAAALAKLKEIMKGGGD